VNILVIGAGAIGCLVGGKLAQTGQTVTLVGRAQFAETVQRQGLQLSDERGAHQIRSMTAVGSMAAAYALPHAAYDLAILTVKSYDTAAALEELKVAIGAGAAPTILSLQNGVGNEEAIADSFGLAAVIAGTITTPVSVQGPGEIRVDRPKYDLGVSAWHPGLPADKLDAAQAALQQAGFAVVRYRQAQGMKWTKLLMNMAGNATSAILDMPPEQVFAVNALIDLELAAWREGLAVMAAAKIPPVNLGSYPFAVLGPLIRFAPRRWLRPLLRRRIGGARGGKLPSLHIDLHQGKRRSEVRWLNGAIVRKGSQVGVPTPVNQVLTETLLSLVGAPQQQEQWRRNSGLLAAAVQRQRRAAKG
jgi:2-dehydropantoate 2-reductase